MFYGLWITIAIIFTYAKDCSCLRNVTMAALPSSTVENGSTVTLQCLYDLEGATLYMVTWNRGNHQVYRYLPSDSPAAKVFPLPGVNVDVSQSNSTQLVLRWASRNVSGNWTCEVTAEAPSYSTASSSLHLTVIVLSHEEPVLWVGDKRKYEAGDVLKANCTSAPSKPSANISFYVNQLPILNDKGRSKIVEKRPVTGQKEMERSWSWLEMELTAFELRRGFLVVECFTTVAGTHRKTAFKHLKAITSEPSPQRVRLMSSSTRCCTSSRALALITLMTSFTTLR